MYLLIVFGTKKGVCVREDRRERRERREREREREKEKESSADQT